MSIRKTMLAAALAALASAGLPALAAGQPAVEGIEPHFTFASGTTTLTAFDRSSSVSCTSVTGTGEFEGQSPWTTGMIEAVFKGCKSSGTSCGTVTAGSGEVEVGPLPFHLVTATDVTGGEAVDGILIAPAGVELGETGSFATFKCAFGLVKVEIKGTGRIGEIEGFAEITNTAQNSVKIDFAVHEIEDEEGEQTDTQTYETIDGYPELAETEFYLESKVGNGEWKISVQKGTGEIAFTEGIKNVLIEEE